MKTAAIIAEFNPFHYGHMVPIQAARKQVGEDGLVLCIMSGNAVQRGSLAIASKFARGRMALSAGADLVVELPAVYVLGSAQVFARGAVGLYHAMGFLENNLIFASEAGQIELLKTAAMLLEQESTQEKIKEEMQKGQSYAAACQNALGRVGAGAVLQAPNNLLGIEYIRAIHHWQATNIAAHTVLRQGPDHDGTSPCGQFASASYLREKIAQGEAAWDYMPQRAADILQGEMRQGHAPIYMEGVEQAILALVRQGAVHPGGHLDDSEGLSGRIRQSARQAGSLEELYQLAKTKRYPMSRIRRMVLTMALGVGAEDRPVAPPYIRVLAAGANGQAALRQMEKTAKIPIISRPGQIKRLDMKAQKVFSVEERVTDLFALGKKEVELRRAGGEWREKPALQGEGLMENCPKIG